VGGISAADRCCAPPLNWCWLCCRSARFKREFDPAHSFAELQIRKADAKRLTERPGRFQPSGSSNWRWDWQWTLGSGIAAHRDKNHPGQSSADAAAPISAQSVHDAPCCHDAQSTQAKKRPNFRKFARMKRGCCG